MKSLLNKLLILMTISFSAMNADVQQNIAQLIQKADKDLASLTAEQKKPLEALIKKINASKKDLQASFDSLSKNKAKLAEYQKQITSDSQKAESVQKDLKVKLAEQTRLGTQTVRSAGELQVRNTLQSAINKLKADLAQLKDKSEVEGEIRKLNLEINNKEKEVEAKLIPALTENLRLLESNRKLYEKPLIDLQGAGTTESNLLNF